MISGPSSANLRAIRTRPLAFKSAMPTWSRSGFTALKLASKPALQGTHEDRARGALVERHRIAAGGRILRRHRNDCIDLGVIDLEAGKRMRHAGFHTERHDEIEKGAKARPQPDIG